MTHSAAAFPFNAAKHRPPSRLCRPLRLLIVAICFSLSQPFAALAQTSAPAPLPSAVQEALDKGILAAKVPDYPLAIRYFEEARKLAPAAPVIFMDLGIAESKEATGDAMTRHGTVKLGRNGISAQGPVRSHERTLAYALCCEPTPIRSTLAPSYSHARSCRR
jgi:hypothetical protein